MTSTINACMEQAVQQGVFPAAELLIAREGEIMHRSHHGAANNESLFDIASLTKPLAIATRVDQLVQTGTLHYEQCLGEFMPRLSSSAFAKATLVQLLNHQAGFPAWHPFYKDISSADAGSIAVREHILSSCAQATPETAPGDKRIYSDLGYLLLGEALEHIDGRDLATQFAENIAQPLQLSTLHFRPLSSRDTNTDTHCLPTEQCPWRNKLVQGVVHDYHAYALGGSAGNAGLFGTALDIYHYMQNIDQLPPHGWDQPSGEQPAAGTHFSKQSIGHLGFTGCSMWYDPEKALLVVLLSNRTHPCCENEQIKIFRPQLHNAIWKCCAT